MTRKRWTHLGWNVSPEQFKWWHKTAKRWIRKQRNLTDDQMHRAQQLEQPSSLFARSVLEWLESMTPAELNKIAPYTGKERSDGED